MTTEEQKRLAEVRRTARAYGRARARRFNTELHALLRRFDVEPDNLRVSHVPAIGMLYRAVLERNTVGVEDYYHANATNEDSAAENRER